RWAQELGYSVVKGRSNNILKQYSDYTRVDLVYTASPVRKPDHHSRTTSTTKQGYS
ncbi:hypothetical protein QBC45DRAFT_398402, partial [Copromyces sp. CBS 386.78]